MHLLDLIMWFVIMGIIWFLLDKIFSGELTEEMGGCIGMVILLIFTIIYCIIFVYPYNVNWVDIFNGEYNFDCVKW